MTFAKTTITAIGLLAAMALVSPILLSAPAGAASASGSTSASTPPSSGGPSSNEPGGPPGGPGGNGGDIPPPPPEQQITKLEETCNAALGQLVKIPEKMVVDFNNSAGVDIAPVCNSGLGHQAKIDGSQAVPLIDAIKNNPVLMAALKARGFTAEDVVGVVLIDGVATLYVHKGPSA